MKMPPIKVLGRLLLLVLFLLLVGIISGRYMPYVSQLVKDPAHFRHMLLSFGPWSLVVFIILQVLQVVIAPLPGEIIQVAGGYVYGVLPGTLYSILGILLGSLIVFYLSRVLGYPLLQALVSQEQMEHFHALLSSKKAEIIVFILFLIPGAPKDILSFVAGATPIKAINFFIPAMLGRFPGIFVSALIGAQLQNRQYLLAGVISCLASLLFLLGVVYRDRLTDTLHRLHHK